ncbi:uncharacterized protein LOC105848884 [Hydra vulgaris]|uniref:uncharacterized protein LOC105848884 n=1 Tax=Hydra vulgaris TaxID=6087 RepID=UPI001F5F260C|nr:uncharacterized protein LOC105848884 [Hydra vulgaris]
MTLPRYASILESSESKNQIDCVAFFQSISQLDVCNEGSYHSFMRDYRNVCIKIVGVSDNIRFCDVIPDSPEFDQFSVDLWKQYYIQEGIVQIALLEDKQPLEGLFIGTDSGRVYLCAQADDFSQQKVLCISPSLHSLIWRGPQNPIEYNSGCMFDNCYGCFDPVLRNRVFRFKQF